MISMAFIFVIDQDVCLEQGYIVTGSDPSEFGTISTKWDPQTIAKLVNNSNFTMVYGRYNMI